MSITEADLVRLLVLGPLFALGLALVLARRVQAAGRLLELIGALHILGGTWVGREVLARMVRRGLFGEADSGLGEIASRVDQEMVFWFLLWGATLVLLGHVVAWTEGQGRRPPAAIGWELLALGLAAGALMPRAGFWFVLLPALLLIRGSRHLPGAGSPPPPPGG